MVDQGSHYFLSRPRRFGKSLLLDTLRELFNDSEELFRGLDIHDHWDWNPEQKHPVVRISFGGLYNSPGDLEHNIITQLTLIEEGESIDPASSDMKGPERFLRLITRLHRITGKPVVILVDEYDKPILDVLENPEMARANRDYLRGFYGIIKDSAEHIRFVFITGVSMFSNVNLFSGLNNLKNISLDARYSTICGYTDNDLDTVFSPELPGLDREEIRHWYNGYSWSGEEKVYNPFDVLLLFDSREYEPHWFRTGTPTFLYRELVKNKISPMELEHRTASKELVSTFDVESYNIDALLFQTGYLTIVGKERHGSRTHYLLDYPNHEVELSLNHGLLRYMTQDDYADKQGDRLLELLSSQDFAGFAEEFRVYLSGIPHPWHDSANLSHYESWYASLLYMNFRAIGVDLRVEESTSRGRSDMVLIHAGQVFIMELKVAEDESGKEAALNQAMAQIRDKGYSEKYRNQGKPIHHIALAFGRTERNLLGVRVECG